jgi:hypothetical protein
VKWCLTPFLPNPIFTPIFTFFATRDAALAEAAGAAGVGLFKAVLP